MKALTVHQPWASLIVAGIKRIENRSRPTNHRGALAIHAAAPAPGSRGRSAYTAALAIPGVAEAAHRAGLGLNPLELPTAAVLGTAQLIDCVPIEELAAAYPNLARGRQRGFATGPWCWILAEAAALPGGPAPCRGQQFLWNWDPPAAAGGL